MGDALVGGGWFAGGGAEEAGGTRDRRVPAGLFGLRPPPPLPGGFGGGA